MTAHQNNDLREVNANTPCTCCGIPLNDGSGGYQCHYVDGKPHHAECATEARRNKYDDIIRAQARLDAIEECAKALEEIAKEHLAAGRPVRFDIMRECADLLRAAVAP